MCNNIKLILTTVIIKEPLMVGDTGGGNVEVTYNYTCYDG